MTLAMKVKGLCFSYPQGEEILHTIDLEVGEGEFILLCGHSGCGKTTFLRCMKEQVAPEGKKQGFVTPHPASEVGFVFQNPENQIVTDTVRHELAFGLENMGMSTETIRRRVAETAIFFGIDEWIDASVHEISGGQKQLLNLASAIAMRPKILLLDEPTSQLDPAARKNFLELLVRVNRELGIAVVLSEHHLEEILPLADSVLFMKEGRFLFEGRPSDFVEYIRTEEPGYLETLPAASRIACVTGCDDKRYPLTVREGRTYLTAYEAERVESDGTWRKALATTMLPMKQTIEDPSVCLQVEHIWFQYHKQTPFVLKGLELEIHQKECHMILGGNGSGKTTLLLVLGQRLRADRGRVRPGKHKSGMPLIGLLPQNTKAMFSRDTVGEELKAAQVPVELAEELALTGHKECHPYDLSGGEQQRLGLALVLAGEPEVLLLDEPVKGLDIEMKKELGQYLRNYAARGNAVVCVTHDTEFAARYADVCSLLFEGEVLSTDPAELFFEDNAFYTTDMVRTLRGFV